MPLAECKKAGGRGRTCALNDWCDNPKCNGNQIRPLPNGEFKAKNEPARNRALQERRRVGALQQLMNIEHRVKLSFRWDHLGGIVYDEDGRLAFPDVRNGPGLYRFRLCGSEEQHYIGEADKLHRRFQHYRTPGRRQPTNKRISSEIRRVLDAGDRVEVDIAVRKLSVAVNDTALTIDLYDKATRVMLEHGALITAASAGTTLLNR